ncbi:uncharacterized protein lekr1 isoform X1 [Gasterosteus aculeatus]
MEPDKEGEKEMKMVLQFPPLYPLPEEIKKGWQQAYAEDEAKRLLETETQHREILRLKEELAEKHERWLSCQRRCDIMQGQLASLCAAEEEVTRGKEALEKVQLERRELRREKLAAALKEQRTQNALQLREQMENLHREVEFEPTATIPAGRHTASEEAGGEKAGATRTARHAGEKPGGGGGGGGGGCTSGAAALPAAGGAAAEPS